MKLINRIKKYFTETPKQNFWFGAFITLLFFRYVTPITLMMLIGFQVGLLSPETEVDYRNISQTVADGLVIPLETIGDAGQTIGREHPIFSKVLFYALAYMVYVFWFAMICLILNLFRYGTSWIIRKYKRKRGLPNINIPQRIPQSSLKV